MTTLQRPRFKSHYRVEVVAGEGLVLLSEKEHSILEGRSYALIATHLEGRRGVAEIVDLLRELVSEADVLAALAHLERAGHLTEGQEAMPAGEAAFWALQDVDSQVAARRLDATKVAVKAVGDVAIEPFAAVLRTLGIHVGEPAQLTVVLTDNYLRAGLRVWNQEALETGRPWLLVKPVGCEIWMGPVFRPEKTGCWECLAQRLRANRVVEAFLQARRGSDEPLPVPRGSTPATLQVAWNLAASKVAEWIVQGELADLEGRVLSVDARTWLTQTHALVWQPQCPACGDPCDELEASPVPIVLESRKKTFTQDGGHRVLPPEATLERFQHHVSPITGAVPALVRHGVSAEGILHTYSAGHNAALRRGGLELLRKGLRSYNGGKGTSDSQARAGALCEALERRSGLFRGDEPRRRARLRDLGAAAIHPNDCMRFSEVQYQRREAWNARKSRFNVVPRPFDENAEIEWTPVWSLTRREPRFLPTAFCYFNYPAPASELGCVPCSNGNAAGNTLEEAILQGFLELVERDSVALWWYNRVRRPAVAVESFGEPYLDQVATYFHTNHRALWALDLTSDLGIPVFAAVSRRTDGPPDQLMFGFGAHLDPRIALLRAVTELNQMLVVMLDLGSGERRGPATFPDVEHELRHWMESATLANQPCLVPAEGTPARVAADFSRRWADDLRDDVLACQALVERHGMEMLVLDQTRADIGLPVVKVIVPGLRHFWARHAAGRLYDVPVRLGWLPRPLSEDELNPVPMFL